MTELEHLTPIVETKDDYDEVEKKIRDLLLDAIYLPLVKELKLSRSKVLKNSRDDLLEAIRSGRLTYSRGLISGKLNATLSKELKALGAKWSRTRSAYTITLKEMPLDLRYAISASAYAFEEKLKLIDQKLSDIQPEELSRKLKISDHFDRALWKVDKDFQKSVKKITVAPQLEPESRRRLAKEWEKNLQLYIKDFTQKEILELREKVKKSFFAGNRRESLHETIQASYGVTARKAKFLARQETNLMMSKYKEVRYAEVGIREYKWKCVLGTPTHPTRKRHKYLSDLSDKGMIFQFNKPPNTSEVGDPHRDPYVGPAGYQNNPGEDFNCRCRAIPVFRKRQ